MITLKQYLTEDAHVWTFSPLVLYFTDAKIPMKSLLVKSTRSGWKLFIGRESFKKVMKSFEPKIIKILSGKMKLIMGSQLPRDMTYSLSQEIPIDDYIIDDIDGNYCKSYDSYSFVWTAFFKTKDKRFITFLKTSRDVSNELSKEFKTQKLKPLLGHWPNT